MPRSEATPRYNKAREPRRYSNRDPCRNHCALTGFEDDIRTARQIQPSVAIVRITRKRQAIFKHFDFNLWRHTQLYTISGSLEQERAPGFRRLYKPASRVRFCRYIVLKTSLVSTMAEGISLLLLTVNWRSYGPDHSGWLAEICIGRSQ